MTDQFTPGPWFYGIAYHPEKGPQPLDYTGPGYYDNPGIIGANGNTLVGCDEYDVFDNPRDTALMVAAPELHAACQAAFDFLGGVDGAAPLRDQLLQALNKAENRA